MKLQSPVKQGSAGWRHWRLSLALGSTLLAFSAVNAQENVDTDEDVFELSPFVVETTEEMGYLATNTLAGTRIKTDLKNLPNSITIATKELMDDLGVDNPAELLPYLGNIETGGADGSYGGASDGSTVIYTDNNRNPQNSTRIRGLAKADNTRNYLATGIVYDGYNVERVAVNRGPNSILFGLGSPGGIVNHQTIQANTSKDSSKLVTAYSSFNSIRGSFDFNRVLIEGKLAVRVAGMMEDKHWRQDPSYSRSKRGTIALTYKPFDNASLRVNYERGEVDARKPRPNAPRDTFSRWWHPAFNQLTHDPFNTHFNDVDRDIIRAPGEWFYNPGYKLDGADMSLIYSAKAWENTWPDGGSQFKPYQVSITKGNQWYPSATAAEYGVEYGSFWGDDEVLDRDVFDWVENMLDGANKNEWEQFHVFNASYDQTWRFDLGSVGYELTYSNETVERSWFDMFVGARGYCINIDVNLTNNWGGENPNFGRPFLASNNQRTSTFNDRETKRVTAFYELDFKNSEKKWMKWFGRHAGTVFAQSYMIDTNAYNARNHLPANATDVMYGNTNLNNGGSNMRTVVYIGDSFADASGPTDGNIYPVSDTIMPNPIDHVYYDRASDSWNTIEGMVPVFVGKDYDNEFWQSIHGKSKNRQITDSWAYVHQTYLFGSEWLVGTLGYRKDSVESYASNTPRNEYNFIDLEQLALNEDPSEDPFEAITRSYGLVAHAPDFIPLPEGVSLSAHWGESENFQIAAPAMDIQGNMLSPPGGTTTDWGFTVGLMDNKFLIKVNLFETTSDNVRTGYTWGLTGMDDRVYAYNSPEAIAAAGFQGPPQYYKDLVGWEIVESNGTESGYAVRRDGAPFSLQDTQSTLSEGKEFDITYNPTPNWRISWNISQQEAVRSNLLPGTRAYLATRIGEWTDTTPGSTGFLISDESNQPLNIRLYDTVINGVNASLAREGQKVSELREWRTNLVTNYRFSDDSKFKGFSVGGAYRWQDEKAIGYPIISKEIEGQTLEVPDLDNPYYDDPITKVDLWVGYKTKIMDGKVNWKIQLNLKNVLGDGEIIAVATQPDGSVRSGIWREGRTFTLRSTFEF